MEARERIKQLADENKLKDNASAMLKLRQIDFLQNMAQQMEGKCPQLSLFYKLRFRGCIKKLQDAKQVNDVIRERFENQLKPHIYTCPYCQTPLSTENSQIKVQPRSQQTKKIRKLLQKHMKNPSSLGNCQKSILARYVESHNILKRKCRTCKKTVKIQEQSRSERLEQVRMTKPKSKQRVKQTEMQPQLTEGDATKKKKRKRKQVKNAGLIIPPTKHTVVSTVDSTPKSVTSRSETVANEEPEAESTSRTMEETSKLYTSVTDQDQSKLTSVVATDKASSSLVKSSSKSAANHMPSKSSVRTSASSVTPRVPQTSDDHANVSNKSKVTANTALPSKHDILKGIRHKTGRGSEKGKKVSVNITGRKLAKDSYRALGKMLKKADKQTPTSNVASLSDFLSGL